MIFSCLSHGGHFLVDILGGIIVAAIAIVLERVICRNIRSLSFEKIKNEEEKIPKALEPINL
jgi:membrane-associated phospholipid phosphatase